MKDVTGLMRFKQIRYSPCFTLALCIVLLAAFGWMLVSPTVALAAPQGAADSLFLAHDHAGEAGGAAASFGEMAISAGLYLLRAFFYFATLFAASIPLLSLTLPRNSAYQSLREQLGKWQGTAMKVLLLATMAYVFLHSATVASSIGGGEDWLLVFTETSLGRVWLAQLALALIGFTAQALAIPGRVVWALGLLMAESFNGHAAAAEYKTAAILLDFVHLASSSLWAGGVMVLLLLWRNDRKEAGRFAERFALAAWAGIALLVVSGVSMIGLLAPSWHSVLYTAWGHWLIAKAVLVIVVTATGYALRRRAKERLMPRGALLKLDGLLMASIVVIASLFTFIGPSSSSEPFRHHQMGATFHYTLKITPNAAGPNQAEAIVWLPMEIGKPENIGLSFESSRYFGDNAIAVRLTEMDASVDDYEFPGFAAYYFESDEFVLPRPAVWTAVLQLKSGNGEEISRSLEIDNR